MPQGLANHFIFKHCDMAPVVSWLVGKLGSGEWGWGQRGAAGADDTAAGASTHSPTRTSRGSRPVSPHQPSPTSTPRHHPNTPPMSQNATPLSTPYLSHAGKTAAGAAVLVHPDEEEVMRAQGYHLLGLIMGGWGEFLTPALRLQVIECFEKPLLAQLSPSARAHIAHPYAHASLAQTLSPTASAVSSGIGALSLIPSFPGDDADSHRDTSGHSASGLPLVISGTEHSDDVSSALRTDTAPAAAGPTGGTPVSLLLYSDLSAGRAAVAAAAAASAAAATPAVAASPSASAGAAGGQAAMGAAVAVATALTKETCVAAVALNHLAVLCILYPEHILHHLLVVLDLEVLAAGEGERAGTVASGNPSRPGNPLRLVRSRSADSTESAGGGEAGVCAGAFAMGGAAGPSGLLLATLQYLQYVAVLLPKLPTPLPTSVFKSALRAIIRKVDSVAYGVIAANLALRSARALYVLARAYARATHAHARATHAHARATHAYACAMHAHARTHT